ncbi:MAG: Nif11-like leader peptide family natural product precursor [Alphaproteobacteria bacterium]|nr:Nif11-like leader peptide family natural product precursor [Alphaproteobacteria bacterium]
MSEKEIERFNADVQANEEMQKELVEAGSGIGSVVVFAKARGYDFSVDEVRDYIEANTGEALSEEQLDAISGGGVVHTNTNINTNTNVNTNAETTLEVVVTHVAVAAGAPVTILVA